MRWYSDGRPGHTIGDIRDRLKFAITPVEMDNGLRVWMEFYWERAEWQTVTLDIDGEDEEMWVVLARWPSNH